MIATAVILAAGVGRRLSGRTKLMHKGFVAIGERSVVEESIEKLLEVGIERIIVGTGHYSEQYDRLAQQVPQLVTHKNARFSDTGSMYTLSTLKEWIEDDFLLLESDLVYEKRGLEELLSDDHEDVVLASGLTGSKDAVYIQVDGDSNLVAMSKDASSLGSIYAELVGISRVSTETLDRMCGFAQQDPGLDYEHAMVGVSRDREILVKRIADYVWCEIDDEDDLTRAEKDVYPLLRARRQ